MLTCLWALFAYQRVLVFTENNVDLHKSITTLSGFKYVIGLSYSAEEMSLIISSLRAMEEAKRQFEQMRDMRNTL